MHRLWKITTSPVSLEDKSGLTWRYQCNKMIGANKLTTASEPTQKREEDGKQEKRK
jgi:hypothetical protein